MSSKFRAFFMKDILLKLIAVLLAIVFWVLISNAQNPSLTRTISVPITYDETWLEENGYAATYKPATIGLQVTVRRSNVLRLSSSDFTATVNMQEYLGGAINEAPKTTKVNLVVSQVSTANYIESWAFTRNTGSYVEVVIDTIRSRDYNVSFNTTGELTEGYILGNLSSNPSRVTVTGPTSAFSNLKSVKAVVDLSQMDVTSENPSVTANLNLYDGNDRLITNSALSISVPTAEVSAELDITKEVAVSVASYSGHAAAGYTCTNFDYSPKIISVTGSRAALAEFSTLTVPASDLNIDGATENTSITLSLKKYLPEGIKLTDTSASAIEVNFAIEPVAEQTFEVSTKQLNLTGTVKDLTYSFADETFPVTLTGLSSELDKLDAAAFNCTVSVEGLTVSEDPYTLPVTLLLASEYTIKEQPTVRIIVSKSKK